MKKINLFLAFLLFATTVFAQKSRFEFGIESGVNVSKIQKYEWLVNDVALESPTWLDGYQMGLALRYRISERWRLKTELNGTMKGWKGQRGKPAWFCATGATPQSLALLEERYRQSLLAIRNNKITYTTVPLLVEYSFWKQRLYAQVGGFWASQKYLEEIETNDFGASIGVGAKLKLLKWLRLNFETRYSQGFSNVIRESVTDVYGNYSYTYQLQEKARGNQTLAFNIGLVFTRH